MKGFVSLLFRGAIAGLVGTAAMTGALYAGKAMGLLQEEPPKEITKHAEERSGMSPHQQPSEVFNASWVAVHLGFGAGCGMAYSLLRRVLPGPAAPLGAVFGLAVWAVNYLGLMPALGLYPEPERDRGSRTAVMIAAHLVYGTVTAEANERLP
jgi:uncharacterized membrane protein YagU involved in acid resistance